LIRLRHLQLHALAFDAACFCAFDAAGSCVFSFDPPSLESLLPALAALFRICAHRLGWISSAIYAVFSALVALRFRRLHSPTISLDVFAWWHWASPSTSPVACIHCQCLRHATAQLHFVSFIFDNLRHSSYPSHSVSLLRSDLPSTCSPSFRIFGTSTSIDFLRKQCRRLRISFAFDLLGCVPAPPMSLALFRKF
jgi:hypothetical protein